MRVPRLAIGLAFVVLLGVAGAAPASSIRSGGERSGAAAPAGRVLVFSIPAVTWSDLDPSVAPALAATLDGAAVANLSTRVTSTRAELGESYLTIGAGTRAVDPDDEAALAFHTLEKLDVGRASEEYERRFGTVTPPFAVVLLTARSLVERNEDSRFGAEVGAIAEALTAARYYPAVLANADRPDTAHERRDRPDENELVGSGVDGAPMPGLDPEGTSLARTFRPHREAAAALTDPDGLVGGQVGQELLRDDPEAPFGVRLDREVVVERFDTLWAPGAVVLVEASDLVRADVATRGTDPEAAARLEARALAWSDDLFASLLEDVDLSRDHVVVVAPGNSGTAELTVLGIAGPGYGPGLLESAQTRKPGFVTIADVGPTLLHLLDVPLPDGIEGRPAVPVDGPAAASDRRARLIDAAADARFRDDLVKPVTGTFVALQVAFVVLAALSFVTGRFRGPIRAGGLWLLAVLPLTYLAALGDFSGWGSGAYLAFVGLGGVAVAALAARLGRGRMLGAPAVLAGLSLAVISTSVVVLDSGLQLSTVFGDSPIVAGRFTGVNNLTFAQLVAGTLLLAALAARAGRVGSEATQGGPEGAVPRRRRRVWIAALLFVGVVVVDGLPMWGADVGGVLAAVPAFALAGLALSGRNLRYRTVAIWCAVAVLAVVGLGLLDLGRPAAERSHLGRLFERMGDDGAGGLWLVVERKLAQNLRTITGQQWRWLLLAFAVVVAFLLWRHRARLLAPFANEPELRAAGIGFGVALVLGFAVNDSGVAVPGMMLAVAVPTLAWWLLDPGRPPDPTPPPGMTSATPVQGRHAPRRDRKELRPIAPRKPRPARS